MTTMTLTNTADRLQAAGIPLLTAWQNSITSGPHTLAQAIQAAVAELESDGSLRPFSPGDVAPFAQARAVLALLADCYTRQIYSSAEAARLAGCDPDFPWPWWEELPRASALRRFRAENGAAIHRCLVAALQFLGEQKLLSGALTRINGPQLAKEASRRIVMAAFADSMEQE